MPLIHKRGLWERLKSERVGRSRQARGVRCALEPLEPRLLLSMQPASSQVAPFGPLPAASLAPDRDRSEDPLSATSQPIPGQDLSYTVSSSWKLTLARVGEGN